MTATALRNEIHTMIDALPDGALPAIKPLLTYISDDYWAPVIEPASEEESAKIKEALMLHEKNPSESIDWEDAKREMGY